MPVTEYTKQQGAQENTEASCSPWTFSENNLSNILEREGELKDMIRKTRNRHGNALSVYFILGVINSDDSQQIL